MLGWFKRVFGDTTSKTDSQIPRDPIVPVTASEGSAQAPLRLEAFACESLVKLPWKVNTPLGGQVTVLFVYLDIDYVIEGGQIILRRVQLSRTGTCIIGTNLASNVSSPRRGEAWYAQNICPESYLIEAVHRDLALDNSRLRRVMLWRWQNAYPDDIIPASVDPPSEKQLNYAKALGITVTPAMNKRDVSIAIDAAVKSRPPKPQVPPACEHKHNASPPPPRWRPELIDAESRWQQFAKDIGYMLAVHRRGKAIVVDVLYVNDAFINERGQLTLDVDAPRVVKSRHHAPFLFWDRSFNLIIDKLLHYEPLNKDFDDRGNDAYRRVVERGLEIARRL